MAKRQPASILVIGGCGSVASYFINYAALDWKSAKFIIYDMPHNIKSTCNIDAGLKSSNRVELVRGSLKNNQLLLNTLLKYQIDTVINLHGMSTTTLNSKTERLNHLQQAILGTGQLLEACVEYGKLDLFLHVTNAEPFSGDSAVSANEFGCALQNSADMLVSRYAKAFQIPTIMINVGHLYGPVGPEDGVVNRIMNKSLDEVNGGFGSLVYIEDACDGIQFLANYGDIGEFYDLSAGNNGSNDVFKDLPLKDTLEQNLDEACNSLSVQDNKSEIEATSAAEKLQNLGWQSKTTLSVGIEKTVNAYIATKIEKPKSDPDEELLILIFGHGWVGKQFSALLEQKSIKFAVAKSRPGTQADEEIEQELITVAPSHVIACLGRTHGPGCNNITYLEGGADKLKENVRDNLYAPWLLGLLCEKLGVHCTYVGTGDLYRYNEEHTVNGLPYNERHLPNYFSNSYCVVKGYTDRMMHNLPRVFNARIRLPISFSADDRNLIVKLVSYLKVFDIPDSFTILPDILPIILDLMKKNFAGTLNMVNPGPVSHSDTLETYRELVDSSKNPDLISFASPEGVKMMEERSHCHSDSSKLVGMYPELRSAKEGIREAIVEIGKRYSKKQ